MWLSKKQRDNIVDRLQRNLTVRRSLPGGGRLFMDRQLPFICLYRNKGKSSESGMGRLAAVEASYLSVPGQKLYQKDVTELLSSIAEIMTERFGAFLILEIWAGDIPPSCVDHPPRPRFSIHSPVQGQLSGTAEKLNESLSGIRTSRLIAEVIEKHTRRTAPPGMKSCIPADVMKSTGIQWMGVEIAPIYLNPEDNDFYPMLFRAVRRQLSKSMKQAFYAFSHECTTHHPPHYNTLGRRAVVKAVWEVDKLLAEIGNSFDLLQQVTPVNAEAAWNKFKRRKYDITPRFLYRPRPDDPGRMKRRLFSVPIDKVEDPTLQRLFLDKQLELDRELSLLTDRNSRAFLFGSLQLHGKVHPSLLQQALELLELPAKSRENPDSRIQISAHDFLVHVNNELDWYRDRNADFHGSAQSSSQMYSGMMVSKGVLFVGQNASFPQKRIESLVQHEVGTHMLTWSNGLAQPLHLLATGLPRYEEFQEGLAVLAEYLTGGLDPQRLHTLAARVIAVNAMSNGAEFLDVFRILTCDYGFSQKPAYLIAMRVFRGGGYAKDAVYLRGLNYVLEYLSNGGSFENCFTGKMGGEHMPVVEELLLRKILNPPAVLPKYLKDKSTDDRLKKIIGGMTLSELLKT